MSLLIAGGLEIDGIYVPFQPNPLYDSVKMLVHWQSPALPNIFLQQPL